MHELVPFFLVPAAIAFCIVGAITWNLKSAVRAAVAAGIIVPILLILLIIYNH